MKTEDVLYVSTIGINKTVLLASSCREILKLITIETYKAHFMYLMGLCFIRDFGELSGCRKWGGGGGGSDAGIT
jgi:hypothetical protein